MRRLYHRIARAVIWAMIPLTFVGSVPRMGCICANGDHKFFCERNRLGSVDGQCACCYGKDRPTAKAGRHPNAATRAKSCCGASCAVAAKGRGISVGAKHPCRPVLDVPQLLTKAKAMLGVDFADQILPAIDTADFAAILPNWAPKAGDECDLPPPDLVIAHRVLLI